MPLMAYELDSFQALSEMGEWPDAITVFERVLEIVPSSARTKTELTQARAIWKKQRERHVRAFSKHFKPQNSTEKSISSSFFNLVSCHLGKFFWGL